MLRVKFEKSLSRLRFSYRIKLPSSRKLFISLRQTAEFPVNTDHIDGSLLIIERENIAILHPGDRAAGCRFRTDVSDCRAARRTREPAVRNQRHFPVQIRVTHNRFRFHQHLRHSGPPRPLITDHEDITRLYLVLHNGRICLLLIIENSRRAGHLPKLRHTG